MAGGEIQLPEPIIQRLQSFLTGKEAARTTIVSKSWHTAWLTRPNLDFDDTHFIERRYGVDEFSKYAKRTIKRYKKSNLKIESFKLCMKINCYGRADLAKKLIVKALRIGATRLCFRLNNNCHYRSISFVLPHKVFGADNLVELSVSRSKINLDDGVVIKCRRLESLILGDGIEITIDTLSNIISGCPSIEKLSLFSDVYSHYDNEISSEDESSEDESWEGERWGGQQWVAWEGQGWRGQREHEEQRRRREAREAAAAMAVGLVDNLLHRLRCLVLSYKSFKMLRLGDLLSRFPFLKDFTLYLKLSRFSNFKKEIQISNCSLERVKLVGPKDDGGCYYTSEERRPRVRFDVPSVRKFTFEGGDTIPLLSFISTPSREWESHVSINCQEHRNFTITTLWFGELSEFLTELSQSKTHLSLHVGKGNTTSFDYKPGDNIIQGLRKHELENLAIYMMGLPSLNCYALFDGLFRLCHPKLITPYYENDPHKRRYRHPYNHKNIRKTNINFLCQTLEQGVHVKVWSPTQFMYGLNDLEEVNAQAIVVDDVPTKWRPIPLKSLIDADAPNEQQRVRLLLKWKPN